jgi:DNA-binding NarL/FixJ family response regulator
MSKQLQVVVVSRHELTRMGLTHLIEVDACRARVLTPSEIGEELPRCDAVIYDLAGREPTTDHYLRHLIATRVAVIVLQPEYGPDFSASLLAMGAADVMSMGVTSEALIETIERAAAGRRTSPASLRADARQTARRATGLTEREIAVLELIATGVSNQQIAATLYVSINTVKSYVRTAYKRIGVDSRSQAVIWALHHGLGPQPDDAVPPMASPRDVAAG